MKLYFSPINFHYIAKNISGFRWQLLSWSIALLALFVLLQSQVSSTTPLTLILLTLFVLFTGLQLLVFSAFIFFFFKLASDKEILKNKPVNVNIDEKRQKNYWFKFYRAIEWCEATLFFILLPLPSLIFIYALVVIVKS